MSYFDFVVKYDRFKDTEQEVVERILYSLFIRKLKGKKPVVTFISGDSGEGKSWAALRLMYILLKLQNIDMVKVNNIVNVHTPLQYPEKLQILLNPKKFLKHQPELIPLIKDTNVLCVHEARNLIKSKKWQDFTAQAVADVNAMSRSIKRIAFIIVSQFIRDITTDVRYTLNYYCKCSRPIGGKTKMYMGILWKDDRDLETPKLKRRKVQGYLVSPSGNYKKFIPDYFEMEKPPKEITDEFEKDDFDAKGKIIHQLMEKMISKMQTEFNVGSRKIEAMVEWYSKNDDMLRKIATTTSRGKWKVKPTVSQMHDLTPTEFKDFVDLLNIKMQGLVNSGFNSVTENDTIE